MPRATPPPSSKPEPTIADVPTQVGVFRMAYRGREVVTVDLLERGLDRKPAPRGPAIVKPPFAADSPPRQLQDYFRGKRTTFELDLDLSHGTEFDQKVWQALYDIPFGSFRTYGEVARRVGAPTAARAVGGAAGRNPIPIIVPCHRLVGEDRSLTGFGMGLWRKRWLLDHEGVYPLPKGQAAPSRSGRQTTLGARA